MTPDLERRLREHLASEVAALEPLTEPAQRAMASYDKHSRLRRAVAAGGVVAALAIGVPVAITAAGGGGARPGGGTATGPTTPPGPATSSSAAPTPVDTVGPQPLELATPPPGSVIWPYRGAGPFAEGGPFETAAFQAWADAYRIPVNQLLGFPLFTVAPIPGTQVIVFGMSKLGPPQAPHTAVYVKDHQSSRLVYDTPADPNAPIAVRFDLDGKTYTLVLADPKTPAVAFAADGTHFTPVTKSPTSHVGPGWAVLETPATVTARARVAACDTCATAQEVAVFGPPPITLASPPAAALQWLYRGTGSNGKPVERDAYRAWAVAHRLLENQLGGVDLFEVAPAPGTLVLLFSIDNNIDAWTGIYVEDHTSQRLVYDTPADNTKPIVAQLLVDGAPYTLIVADPKTPVITFASDGVNFVPVTKTPTTQVGKAWALIPGLAPNGRVRVAACATCLPIEVPATSAH